MPIRQKINRNAIYTMRKNTETSKNALKYKIRRMLVYIHTMLADFQYNKIQDLRTLLQWFGEKYFWCFSCFLSQDHIWNPCERVYHLNQSGVGLRHFFTPKIVSEALDLKKEKSPKGALFLVWRKVLMVWILVNVVHFWSGEKSSWCKQEHHKDFSPRPKCHVYWSQRPFGANFYLF